MPVAVAVAVALLTLGAPAAAQQPRPRRPAAPRAAEPTPPRAASAAALFDAGCAALNRGEWDAAVAQLEASYALAPEPIVLLNLGIAYRGARRYGEATAALERYLAAAGGALTAARAALVRNTLAQIAPRVAWVGVRSEPAGALVRVDGREQGRTPLATSVPLTSGVPHRLELELPGYVHLDETVVLAARERRELAVRLASAATAATLAVAIDPPAAPSPHIAIDGFEVAGARATRQLVAGGHRVEARAAGYEPFRAEVVLAPQQRRVERVRLRRAVPLAAQPLFWVGVGAAVVVLGIGVGVPLAVRAGEPAAVPIIHPM